MDSSQVPVHLLEPVCALYRKCKNAEEGTRLPKLQAEMRDEFPELSEADLAEASRIAARLIIDQIDPTERTFLRRAARKTLQRA